jgi:glutathione S-transferase
MILYYSPGACSLVPHIALEEAGAEFTTVRVPIIEGAHRSADYLKVNPHGRVPALGTDQGVIGENIAVLSYIALQAPGPGSIPFDDPFAAAKTVEKLSWFASSVHIAFAQVWRGERFVSDPALHPAIERGGREVLAAQFEEIEESIGAGWLVAERFTSADSYLLTFFRWAVRIGFDMAAYPGWAALVARTLERPAVQRAIAREELDLAQFRLAA